MKCCRHCDVNLIVGDNWTPSNKKYYNYICVPCSNVVKKKWEHKKQGVYGIFAVDKCLYVGESKRLDGRISQHKTYIKNPFSSRATQHELYISIAKYDNVQIKILEETPNHKEREKYWIEQLQPEFNGYV